MFNKINQIFEGGNAVPNVVPIRAEDTMPTLEDIENKIISRFFKLKKDQWAALGSTGKKLPGQSSGDIDIAIDMNWIAKNFNVSLQDAGQKVFDILSSAYPDMDKNYMKGLGIISVAYPIKGSSGNVQVDFMLQDDIDFAKWMFHSPDFTKNESKWKGLYRTELLKSIGNSITIPELTEYWEDEFEGQYKGTVKKLGRTMLDMNKGYKKQIKSFVGKKGNPVKTGTVEFEELLSKDPIFITKSLLGQDAEIKDTNSFETVWKKMNSSTFPWKKHLPEIIVYFTDLLRGKGLPMPSELGVKEQFKMKKFNEIHIEKR
jgi:hypothetical protein